MGCQHSTRINSCYELSSYIMKNKKDKSAQNAQRNFINFSDADTTIRIGFFYARIAYLKLSRSITNHINMEEPGNQLIDLNY